MNNNNQNEIRDDSAEAGSHSQVTSSQNTAVAVLQNIENLIKSHIAQIDRIKVETKKHREMMADVLNNDAVYKEHDQKAKEAAKVKMQTKSQIMKQPNMMALSLKVKDNRASLKDLEGALSEYLREYGRLTGSNEIEGEDGEVREIVFSAKLIKKSKFKNNG